MKTNRIFKKVEKKPCIFKNTMNTRKNAYTFIQLLDDINLESNNKKGISSKIFGASCGFFRSQPQQNHE